MEHSSLRLTYRDNTAKYAGIHELYPMMHPDRENHDHRLQVIQPQNKHSYDPTVVTTRIPGQPKKQLYAVPGS